MVFFLFSDYSKSTVGKNGDSPEGSMFLPNCTRFSLLQILYNSAWNFVSAAEGMFIAELLKDCGKEKKLLIKYYIL